MSAPDTVSRLVDRFDRNIEAYHSGAYNEAQVRREFIDPMWKALGWDIDNQQGYAEAYKDVIHEDSIRVGGAVKAPDYCFRIGGTRKFFLEAKKPSVKIDQDIAAAFQLRRYAWSAKLPLSVLTDFEEFAVYDCRLRPTASDKSAIGRTLYIKYTDYAERWGDIASIFSREEVLRGSFDKYAESARKKRGTAEVDAAFLAEIESWRDELARNLARRNANLTQRDLNFAVQRIIDRIIFLRICEARNIEDYGRLLALRSGDSVYARLQHLFEQADDRYNSGLFHFHKERNRSGTHDRLTPKLSVDDKVLKGIIKNLYYPDSPYEFSVLPADILGQVYEQFLGKVIRLTKSHQAKVEEKPEVRKAGGVYYTPTYIVDYIVEHTVGKLLEGKTPGPRGTASKLRILDPACGSGSFLLGAYQYLLDWHLEQYAKKDPKKWTRGKNPAIYEGPDNQRRAHVHAPKSESGNGGSAHEHARKAGAGQSGIGASRCALRSWRLTTNERKRILLNNIYGVDIDPQAVEVTKLSLLLKVLEDQTAETIGQNLALFHERALPDLADNIKCGNSLIGPDFYKGQQIDAFDDDELYRINAFDWDAEFVEIMKKGGFDAVIGNPPYIRMESFKDLKEYLRSNYTSHEERADIYAYFIEKAHGLLRCDGVFGMIVSNKFLRAKYGRPLRTFLASAAHIREVVDFAGLPVFIGATVRTVVLLTNRQTNAESSTLYSPPVPSERFKEIAAGTITVGQAIEEGTYQIASAALGSSGWSFARPEALELINRLTEGNQALNGYVGGVVCMGVKSGLTRAFVVSQEIRNGILDENPKASEVIKPFLNGRDVRRYCLTPQNLYLIYTYHGVPIGRYPAVERHLAQFRRDLQKRATRQEWYELQQPQYAFDAYMRGEKIVFPDIATAPRFTLDEAGFYGSNTTYFVPGRDVYLLGLLNSRLACFYFKQTCAGLEGANETYLRFFGQYLEGFPICPIDFTDRKDKGRHDEMVRLVERMLGLHKQVQEAGTEHAKTVLERQIAATDEEIDRLVYELYGLTEDEIAIVEESTKTGR